MSVQIWSVWSVPAWRTNRISRQIAATTTGIGL
jgi:hypothetical protein